jgi:ATP-dependent Clp protease adapter protein ClpS
MSEFDLPDFLKPNADQPEVGIIEEIEESTDDGTGSGLGTKVIVFNDNYHTFDQVINQLMIAIKCSEETAFYHAKTIHEKGQSTVYKGKIERCLDVASILREINLKVQVVG